MSGADLDRALAWLLQAPPPRLLAAPRAGAAAAALSGSAAWLVRLAQSCGALPGRCAPPPRRRSPPAAAVCAAGLWPPASQMFRRKPRALC